MLRLHPPLWLSLSWLLLACHLAPTVIASEPRRVFLIGNSLTWDTIPHLLGDGVAWHVDCGKNLMFIYEHPQKPCVTSSVLWPDALKNRQYDVLCVQPHFGTTLEQDVEVISKWLELQPEAELVIHTGWNRSKDFEAAFHASGTDDRMTHSPQYFTSLTEALQKRFPAKRIRTTGVLHVLDEIYHDIEQSRAPFQAFSDLYRDEIHMKHHVGRYLAHNLMRVALDLPISAQGFQIDQAHRDYFDGKIKAYQQAHPSPANPTR